MKFLHNTYISIFFLFVNKVEYPLPESTVLKIDVLDIKTSITSFHEIVGKIKATDKTFVVTKFVAVEYCYQYINPRL